MTGVVGLAARTHEHVVPAAVVGEVDVAQNHVVAGKLGRRRNGLRVVEDVDLAAVGPQYPSEKPGQRFIVLEEQNTMCARHPPVAPPCVFGGLAGRLVPLIGHRSNTPFPIHFSDPLLLRVRPASRPIRDPFPEGSASPLRLHFRGTVSHAYPRTEPFCAIRPPRRAIPPGFAPSLTQPMPKARLARPPVLVREVSVHQRSGPSAGARRRRGPSRLACGAPMPPFDAARVGEHVHGHLGWLAAVALIHPAILLRRRERRADGSVALAVAIVTLAGALGAGLYPSYRERLKQPLFLQARSLGYLFERKEHLAFGAILFAWVGALTYAAALKYVDVGERDAMRKAAHWAFVAAAILSVATAVLGTVVASYKTF